MLPEYLTNLCEDWELVGSRVTCNPPPTDTDQDILVLVDKANTSTFLEELKANKWKACTGTKNERPEEEDFDDPDDYMEALEKWLEDNDDTYGTLADGAAFASWRLGELNIILTQDEEWYDSFLVASEACRALNVLDKKKRIEIFQKVVPKQLPVKSPKLAAAQMPSQFAAANTHLSTVWMNVINNTNVWPGIHAET